MFLGQVKIVKVKAVGQVKLGFCDKFISSIAAFFTAIFVAIATAKVQAVTYTVNV